MTAAALCAGGLEKVVANELRKLGLSVLEARFGRVRFRADLAGLYRALMSLRAADRVLLEAGRFFAPDFDALFEGVGAIEWEALIPRAVGLRVSKVRAHHSRLQAETTVQAMTHKAVAARLCAAYKLARLPDTIISADIRVYIEKDEASLFLDLSGEALFKRGYRQEGGAAPLRETTAAALLLLAGWRRKFPLCDPFCGSGTFAVEAALYAWDMAPGLGRAFALSGLGIADSKIERLVREELAAKVDFSRTIRIWGTDEDAEPVRIARSNAQRAYMLALGKEGRSDPAPVQQLPDFRMQAMRDLHAPSADAGFIITNPPYGKRLGDRAGAERIYQEMEALRRHFPGWKLGVISSHAGFESFFGRKADSCRELINGALQSYFFVYERL
jgi:putative N6-adenine-specific DNA methylase